jgi:hypothetical protein
MKSRITILLMVLSLLAAKGWAQVNMTMSFESESYLLYETIPVKVGLKNIGDQNIQLNNTAEGVSDWISFNIIRADGSKVRAEKELTVPPLTLPPGEFKSVVVDVTPAYALRDTGQYTIQAMITIPGMKPFITESRVFYLGKGDKIWSQERIENGTRRVYSLIKFLNKTESDLYVRVEEPTSNTIYATQRLGRFTAFTSPVVKFDATGTLHVVHTVSGQTYRYSMVDADGLLLKQEDRMIQGERPSLVDNGSGGIKFIGGTPQQEKKTRPKLSEGQQGLM